MYFRSYEVLAKIIVAFGTILLFGFLVCKKNVRLGNFQKYYL